jgi:hypothetical protein
MSKDNSNNDFHNRPVINQIRFYKSADDQDLDRIKEAVNRTDAEKFAFLMNLMKLQLTFKKGTIHHKS